MILPSHKTRIVCTIGPASESPEIIASMLLAGMDVARINFSHGTFDSHKRVIEKIRTCSRKTGKRVAIMADLPGPKMRIGQLTQEPVELNRGDPLTLTSENIIGDRYRVSMTFDRLPEKVKTGDTLFLNDGLIQLEVKAVQGRDVLCRVIAGGELRSRKGLNLPGIDLGISAFTERDRECLIFALDNGVDAISQSFVEKADDVQAVREAATKAGYNPFIIAKIERAGALDNMEEILAATDGIMTARGDLGVEIPIERIAIVQKKITRMANIAGKPVITATQMLESMTNNRRPTRAEATDVANAILDGTDCVMLSEESAMGRYPVEAVHMLAGIAAVTEPNLAGHGMHQAITMRVKSAGASLHDLISLSVETAVGQISPAVILVPTRGGTTARSIARFRLPPWIAAVSPHEETCRRLQFTFGVYPVFFPDHPENWKGYASEFVKSLGIKGDFVVLTEGPSEKYPGMNNRMEIIDLRGS